jgi:hypothetical protein
MPFDNFYKSEDEARRLWWKCLGGAVLFIIGYCSLFFVLPESQPVQVLPKPASFDSYRISDTVDQEALQHLNELCAGLPQPEKFDFKGSGSPTTLNDNYTMVIYRYSSKRSREEIMPVFLVWFNEHGWEREPYSDSIFKKGNQTIFVGGNNDFSGKSNYVILCAEKK